MRHLLIGSLWLAACKHHEPAPPPPPSDLVVVSPGVLPHHQLAYHLAKGTKTTIELELEGKLVAGDITSASPPLVFTLDVTCDDVLRDGRMKLTSTVQELTARAEPDQPGAPKVRAEAAAVKGLAITSTLSADGTVSDVHAVIADKQLSDVAKAEIEQLVQALPKLAMPLPTTPVGVGAKWRCSRAIITGGPTNQLALTSVTTIDVSGIANGVVTYELSSTVHGADQVVKQEDVAVDIKGITGTATGHGTFDLDKLAITGSLGAELHMDMTTGSDRTPMTMTLELRSQTH